MSVHPDHGKIATWEVTYPNGTGYTTNPGVKVRAEQLKWKVLPLDDQWEYQLIEKMNEDGGRATSGTTLRLYKEEKAVTGGDGEEETAVTEGEGKEDTAVTEGDGKEDTAVTKDKEKERETFVTRGGGTSRGLFTAVKKAAKELPNPSVT